MPHHNERIGRDGPVVDLAVTVGRAWQQESVGFGTPVPEPMTIRALIDTGWDLSAIHPELLHQMGVNRAGFVQIRRPGLGNQYRLAFLFEVQVAFGGIPPKSVWIPVRAVGMAPSTPSVLALIGRDILAHCTLYYNGPRGDLPLSY